MCIVLIAHLVYYSLTTFNVYCINSTLSVLQSDYIVFDVLMCIVLTLIMFTSTLCVLQSNYIGAY